MMDINKILYYLNRNYEWGEDKYGQFRFVLLYGVAHIIFLFVLLHLLAYYLDLVELVPFYLYTVFVFQATSFISLYLLRKDKKYYTIVSWITLISVYIVSFVALVLQEGDEMRLVWFLIILFITLLLKGKKVGQVAGLIIIVGVYVVIDLFDLDFSQLAIYTFYNSFVSFFIVSLFFIHKIEHDEKLLSRINQTLKEQVEKEVQARIQNERILLRQARMASMGEMVDAIAHQWRQPLMNINAVMMNIDRGIEVGKDKEILAKKILEVFAQTAHMSNTIEDFRNLLKVEKEKSAFDVEGVVANVLTLLKNNLKHIKIVNRLEKGISLESYRSELSQVLIILLSNASEICMIREIKKRYIYIISSQDDDGVTLSIEDNAGGILDSDLSKIFDPYYTTKKQTGGTGLGLYIAKIIIEHNMQGSLDVINTTDGAKFTIRIPFHTT